MSAYLFIASISGIKCAPRFCGYAPQAARYAGQARRHRHEGVLDDETFDVDAHALFLARKALKRCFSGASMRGGCHFD